MNPVSTHPPHPHPNGSGKLVELVLLGISVLICGALILTARPSHDENMYIAAAQLIGKGALYRDFAYLQAPYMPYIYHWVLGISQSDELLTVARLFKVLITAVTLIVVYLVCLRLSRDRWFSIACCLLLVGNDIFRDTITFAKNSDMSVLLILAGIWVFLTPRSARRQTLAIVSAGILLGLATGTRLTSGLVPLCFIGGILVGFGFTKRSVILVAYFVAAVFLALVPAIVISLRAGIDVAEFNNIGYHHLNTIWRQDTGYSGPMTLASKLTAVRVAISRLPSALLLYLVVWLGALRIGSKGLLRSEKPGITFLILTLVVVALLIYLIPTPVFMSYLSLLAVSLVLVAALFCGEVDPAHGRVIRIGVWCLVAVLAMRVMPGDMKSVARSFNRENWTSRQIHEAGEAIRSAIPPENRHRPVATLNPLYALEGGLPIYPELATGPFAYRIGTFLTEEQLARYKTTSARNISALLDASPPSAVVVGFEGDLDSALTAYAAHRGYNARDGVIDGGTVFINASTDVSGRGP